jgi:hypothetical protein
MVTPIWSAKIGRPGAGELRAVDLLVLRHQA